MRKAVDILYKIELVFSSVLLTIFLITVLAQMFTRYLGITALWTEDVSMYSFIGAVFLGAAIMVRENKNFAFTALSDKIRNPKKKAILYIFIRSIMLAFAVCMLIYGIILTKKFWNYTWVSIPTFKRGFTWLCIPFSALTMIVYLLEGITDKVKTLKSGGTT